LFWSLSGHRRRFSIGVNWPLLLVLDWAFEWAFFGLFALIPSG
jgi:hypothetical protein